MFANLKIPRKLAFAFLCICISVALMLGGFFVNMWMISRSTEMSNKSRAIYAEVQDLENQLLRQNSQLRGFLVTGDDLFLKSYYEGRDKYDETSKKLEAEITEPAALGLLKQSREETLTWRRDWGDRLVDVVHQGALGTAAAQYREAGKKALVSAAVLPLRDLQDGETQRIETYARRQDNAILMAVITLIVGGLSLIGIAVFMARMLGRSIATPISALTDTMGQLAAGNNSVVISHADRTDELGDMARAVSVFRDAALAKAEADRAQAHVVEELGKGLKALASGDMTYTIAQPFDGDYENLRHSFNASVEGLESSLLRVAECAANVHGGASELRSASEDLSHRTEAQAAAIEETAAATKTVSGKVGETAQGAAKLSTSIATVQADATKGTQVVRRAVVAMDEIRESSGKVEQIIDVIEGIAFQTNLLALNAGVEAARAGDAGKGFAVVANEVRSLAQRSSEAAKDIQQLITTSSGQVHSGVELVGETGIMLDRILAQMGDVTALIASMADAAQSQANNLGAVSGSIGDLDRMTQQNAAMVEEATACTRQLAAQADELNGLVTRFQLRQQKNGSNLPGAIGAGRSNVSVLRSAPASSTAPRPAAIGNLAIKDTDDSWSEF